MGSAIVRDSGGVKLRIIEIARRDAILQNGIRRVRKMKASTRISTLRFLKNDEVYAQSGRDAVSEE